MMLFKLNSDAAAVVVRHGINSKTSGKIYVKAKYKIFIQ